VPYMIIAGALGIAMLMLGIIMVRRPLDLAASRRVLLFSIIYLPTVLLAMVLDKV
jgi:heme O synthase-like polyprenyltransferase